MEVEVNDAAIRPHDRSVVGINGHSDTLPLTTGALQAGYVYPAAPIIQMDSITWRQHPLIVYEPQERSTP